MSPLTPIAAPEERIDVAAEVTNDALGEGRGEDVPPVRTLIPVPGITFLGGSPAMVCEGDVCEVPQHLEAHLVARRVDEDLV